MSEKWDEILIDEIKDPSRYSLAMGPFGSNITTDNFVAEGVPVIRGGNLSGVRFKDSDFVFLTEEKADELKSANAFPGDIIFTHRGTLGQVGIIPQNAMYPRYVVSQSQMKLSCDSSKVDPLFVFYFFRSNQGQYSLLSNSSTTGVPAIGSPLTTLRNIRIPYPPLPIQRRIAHILGSIDDKIELNRQMNETLEAMARAIFKSWFVDFDPVRAKAEGRQPVGMDAETAALFPDGFEEVEGREVPRGWKFSSLDGLFPNSNDCVVTGPFGSNLHASDYRDDGVPIILVKHVMNGHILDDDLPKVGHHKLPDLKRYFLKKGDIVFTRVGAVGRSAYVQDHQEGWLISGQTLRVRISDWDILHPRYLAQLFLEESFIEMVNNQALGTTRPSLNTQLLLNFEFIAPPGELVKKFVEKISCMDTLLQNNIEQSRTLTQIRDTLLPKLMSGEIQVG